MLLAMSESHQKIILLCESVPHAKRGFGPGDAPGGDPRFHPCIQTPLSIAEFPLE
jgi:hypothetical protein